MNLPIGRQVMSYECNAVVPSVILLCIKYQVSSIKYQVSSIKFGPPIFTF